MPTLFISYKRKTAAVAPLMERLRQEHYRLWFDRDEIHLGDPDWQVRIDQGLQRCDGVILNITPAACQSEPVRYEVRKARELGKRIFPIILEQVDYNTAIRDLGLADNSHIEDFTEVTWWEEQIQRLLRDLEIHGLRVTPHDRRQQRDRNNTNYVLHQAYLKRLAERIGTLNLAQINPENAQGVALEQVYIDSPTGLSLSVEVQNWQVVDWWIGEEKSPERGLFFNDPREDQPRQKPHDLGYETAPFESLINGIDARIADYRQENPDQKPDEKYLWNNFWNNGVKKNLVHLHLNHLAAARDRLVILGAPGSGKSTFVKYLALCLAGAGIDDWTRQANLTLLENWPHGALTPVYIELRRFVASPYFPADLKTPVTADHLWAYIEHDLLGVALAAYAADLQYDLEHGHAVLILDGLDEVPYPDGKLKARQQQLISLAQSLNTRYATSRIIVASRPYAYAGWTLPGFQAVTITEFKDNHRAALASRLYQAAGLDTDTAKEKAQALNHQLQQVALELKDRPLFVTLMATIYLHGDSEGLPTRPGTLYRESILLLLDRWTQSKPGIPSLLELLGDKSLDDLYTRLAALAYEVHEQHGGQQDPPDINEGLLYQHLRPLGRNLVAELIPYLSENAGVLVSLGQDSEKEVFRFAHRTFQEYLAAVHLVTLCTAADSFHLVRERMISKPQTWRVPCVLAGDVLADTHRRGHLWELLEELLEDEITEGMTANDPRWWAVWLSGVILEEQKLLEGSKRRSQSKKAICDQMRDWLLALIQTPQALSPVERADCGRALGLLGDPRPGVGVKNGIPDIAWCEIPGGPFLFGSNREKDKRAYKDEPDQHEVSLPTFRIAKYPVTYAQYEVFVQDGGYEKRDYWTEAGWNWKGDKLHPEWGWNDPEWHIANYPVVGVTWYEAVAFCNWLSAQVSPGSGVRFRLPTEAEFEKAARGDTDWIYPYGDAFDAHKGNTVETGIGRTSAVGIFPAGASRHGVLDISGNVWEWSLSPWANPYEPHTAAQVEVEGDSLRVVRGGSWSDYQDDARVSYRNYDDPNDRFNNLGFRLVSAPLYR